jgi:hypothetical protein
MSEFTVDTFYFGRGIERFHGTELLADPALIAQLGLDKGMAGGLTFSTSDSQILIDDDFDTLTKQMLVELPQALRQGHGKRIELPVSNDAFEVTLQGDEVSFDFGDGRVMTEGLAEVLAALEAAAQGLAKIRAAAGAGA